MRLLNTIIPLLIFIRTTPSEASTPEEKLLNYYEKECNKLAGVYCVKLENIVKQLLNDKTIQEKNSSAIVHEFQRNLTHFQELYPHYRRFGLNETLLKKFNKIIMPFYHNKLNALDNDATYLLQSLRKLGYDEMRQQYKNEFSKFVNENFSPKFEELKKQLTNNSQRLEYENKFSKLVNKLKQCSEYECYLNSYEDVMLTPRERLFEHVRQQVKDMTLFYYHNATLLTKRILTDINNVGNLSADLRQELKQRILDFVTVIANITNMNEIFFLDSLYKLYVIEDFYKNEKIPSTERETLKTIFDNQGYTQNEINFTLQLDEFLKNDFLREFEKFKADLSQEELAKEKNLLDMFEHLKRATTYDERVAIFNKFKALRQKLISGASN